MDQFIVLFTVLTGSVLMPLFVGMGLVAAERSERSLGALLALPVRSWKILAVKMAMGAAVCIGPILGSMLVALLIAAGREITASRIVVHYLGGVAFSLAMLVWIVGLSVSQPSEARAGLVGVAIFVGWVFIAYWFDTFVEGPSERWALVITPFGFLEATINSSYDLLPKVIPVQLLIGVCLLLLATWRFGRLARTE